jgi:hypothetical protein
MWTVCGSIHCVPRAGARSIAARTRSQRACARGAVALATPPECLDAVRRQCTPRILDPLEQSVVGRKRNGRRKLDARHRAAAERVSDMPSEHWTNLPYRASMRTKCFMGSPEGYRMQKAGPCVRREQWRRPHRPNGANALSGIRARRSGTSGRASCTSQTLQREAGLFRRRKIMFSDAATKRVAPLATERFAMRVRRR